MVWILKKDNSNDVAQCIPLRQLAVAPVLAGGHSTALPNSKIGSQLLPPGTGTVHSMASL